MLVLGLFAGLVAAVDAPPTAPPTEPPRSITVILDDNFPPFTLRDANGQLQGLLKDRWQLWQEHTGIAVELKGMDWAEAQRVMRAGGADVIDTISRTPAREPFYDFSAPYADLDVMLFFREHLSGIVDAASSRQFVIGVKDGDRCIDQLLEASAEHLQRYPSYAALVTAAARNEVAVFCMNQRPAEYLLTQAGLRAEFRHTPPIYTSQFHWAVGKGNTALRRRVADGFARIPPGASRRLEEKWFGAPVLASFTPYLHYAGYLLLGLIVVLLLMAARVYAMRQAVQHKTAELDNEQRLGALIEQGLAGVCECDLDGHLIRINDRYCEIVGQARAALIGRHLSEFMLEVDWAAEQALFERLRRGAGSGVIEKRYRRQDGGLSYAQVAIALIRDAAGEPAGFQALLTDITELKQAEQRLRDSERRFRELNSDLERKVQERTAEAVAANAAKSEFLAHMSHEIRTPLNAVLGLTQLLGREPLGENQRDLVERICTAGKSLLVIINDLLDLSKIEAGQLRIEPHPFDLGTLLAEVDSLMGSSAQAKGVRLRVSEPPRSLGPLVGDVLRLQQVLINLVGNAIKFTERGEVTLQVQVIETGELAVWLRFTVRDTGIGIAPAVLPRLFAPFTQADAGITRRFGGTGLGLSICKRLVELMGGEIGVESQSGQGSTFWFRLVLARAPAGPTVAVSGARPVASGDSPPCGSRLAGLNLLVVDDSAMSRDLVERALAYDDARATLAADGQLALEILRTRPTAFDAVLMDVQMPIMDGLTATRLIRTKLGLTDLPVIAFTAGVSSEQRAAARAAGVNDLLPKPLDLQALVNCLLRWVSPRPAAQPQRPEPAATPLASDDGAAFPDIAGIDRARAAQTLSRKRALFLRLLERFADEFADLVERVRHALAQGERETAGRWLHTLRGSAGTLGALGLMTSAEQLETAIAAGETELEARLASLGIELAALIEASAPWRGAATTTTPAAPGSPPPPAAWRQRLREDLRRHNMRALRRFDELQPVLMDALGEADTAALGRAIRGLRFGEALAVLDQSAVGGGDHATIEEVPP